MSDSLRHCDHPLCQEPYNRLYECDNCLTLFCEDHGTISHDVAGGTNPNGSPYGEYAVPSMCWKCGGFNADEGAGAVQVCEYCGENKPLHMVHTFDSCPTDRGEERREYDIYVCNECDRNQAQ